MNNAQGTYIASLERVLEAAFLAGGGDIYQEEFGRICICSGCRILETGGRDTGKHTTACDELNKAVQDARIMRN